MRYLTLILLVYSISNFITTKLYAQKKLDNYFLLGDYKNLDTIANPRRGGISVEFTKGTPHVYRKDRQMSFDRDIAIMCNDTGKLLFYTNGIYINDARDTLMENGDTLNSGNKEFLDFTNRLSGGWLPYASIIVPMPDEKYYLFHTDYKESVNGNNDYYPAQIKVSSIDMNQNVGFGKVVNKGKLLWDVGSKEVQGLLTATQHANGRDWWIMTNTYPYNKYISFLATPDSVYGPYIQEFGTFDNTTGRGNGGLVFSPDGTKLAYTNLVGGFVFFDFDRCTGKLTNYRLYPLGDVPSVYGNIIFSPNSKYLYVTTGLLLWQMNTDTTDIIRSLIKVDTFDGFKDPFLNSFYMMAIGPDGKIYMASGNGVSHLHVIHEPNERGIGCDFRQHDLSTNGIYFGFGMPNIPNYRLGPLKGSPCDTLLVANKEITSADYGLKLFPNPASTDIKIDITLKEYDPNTKTEVIIVDVSGAIVQKYTMPDFAYIANLDVSNLPSGVYGVQLRQPRKFGERILAVEKLVVVR